MQRHFLKETLISAPAKNVFDWHLDPEAFNLLVPPWEPVKLVSLSAPISEPGAIAVLEIKLLGILPLQWVARHQNFQVPENPDSPQEEAVFQFQDVQESGPFAYWQHTHRVIAKPNHACLLQDDISYRLPLGLLGDCFGHWFVRQKIEKLFHYRHQVVLKSFSG
ncbi:MAG: SRPBCC family protein [Cyanobacteria bacterium P01_H01_bin.74]